MTHYLGQHQSRSTPQSEPILGTYQVENSAGGYVWELDKWARLRRFLILGSEGGTYYAAERDLTRANVDNVLACIKEDGARTVGTITGVSVAGRAPKNDPAILALALAASYGNDDTRKAALDSLPIVCRTGTHLFMFAAFVSSHRGWGRGLRNAIGRWYTEKDPDALAYQMVKYRQRYGWTHRDLLRVAHPAPVDEDHLQLYRWATGKGIQLHYDPPASIRGFQAAQNANTPHEVADVVHSYGSSVPREALPPEHLDREVWAALVDVGMPMTALIRNLATMTRSELLTPTSAATQIIVQQLTDTERLRNARVHPIQALSALVTYASGRSARGDSQWVPIPQIIDALDDAFYASFGNVDPTGKRYLLGLDVSSSMTVGAIAGVPGLTPRTASTAMAMTVARSGDPFEAVAFTSRHSIGLRADNILAPFPISAKTRLDDACNAMNGMPFGGTDCALPMLYAIERQRDVDVFVVYTDNETWHGQVHPAQALRMYRQASGIDARLVVVGMTATEFAIADPRDRGMMDVVGFDSAAPSLIAGFAAGEF